VTRARFDSSLIYEARTSHRTELGLAGSVDSRRIENATFFYLGE